MNLLDKGSVMVGAVIGWSLGVLMTLVVLCSGCSSMLPYNMSIGENFDDHGRNRSHYIGFDFDLKPNK